MAATYRVAPNDRGTATIYRNGVAVVDTAGPALSTAVHMGEGFRLAAFFGAHDTEIAAILGAPVTSSTDGFVVRTLPGADAAARTANDEPTPIRAARRLLQQRRGDDPDPSGTRPAA